MPSRSNQILTQVQEESNTDFENLILDRNIVTKGELCRLVACCEMESIKFLQKTIGVSGIRAELFFRDNLQQTPLALAFKSGEKQLISLLLLLGKVEFIPYLYIVANNVSCL